MFISPKEFERLFNAIRINPETNTFRRHRRIANLTMKAWEDDSYLIRSSTFFIARRSQGRDIWKLETRLIGGFYGRAPEQTDEPISLFLGPFGITKDNRNKVTGVLNDIVLTGKQEIAKADLVTLKLFL